MLQTLREYIKTYPHARIEDLVKLLYQGRLGCGHFVSDEQTACRYLAEEYKNTAVVANKPLFETIGADYCRLNLSSAHFASLPIDLVGRMFFLSATAEEKAQKALYIEDLLALGQEIAAGRLPYSYADYQNFYEKYKQAGYPAIHHSAAYKDRYAPAYRVVRADYFHLYPVIKSIAEMLAKNKPVTAAIDGPSGTGKSYSAQILAELFSARVIHMDDYFLRPAQRNEKRLREAGGNLDYERFLAEVIPNLGSGAFSYQKYDCQTGLFSPQPLPGSRVTIVEGVYSLHPQWGRGVYDLAVFFTAELDTRLARIQKRNGEKMLKRFTDEWIPKEDRYFSEFSVQSACDLTIDTTAFGR